MDAEVVFDSPERAELERDDSFATLYAASFPPEEQEPLDVISGSLASGVGVVLRARLRNRTIGLATAHLVRQPAIAFMVYLAVSPEMRRHGIGTQLFEALWQTCAARGARDGVAPRAFVWEIDAPHLAPNEAERTRRLRRRQFFSHRGGDVWLETYWQPPVRDTTPVPMVLMGRVAAGAARPLNTEVVHGIYREKYQRMNGLDSALLDELAARSLGGRG